MTDLFMHGIKKRTCSGPEDLSPQGPKFSVVLVTFQRPNSLRMSLEALASQKNAPWHELIIIDNDNQGSGRPTVAPFLALQPGWQYLISPRNNVSLARNLGAGLAGGRMAGISGRRLWPLS